MKTILLLIAIIPSFVYSQSLVFTHDFGYISAESSSHEILSSGQQIELLQSYDIDFDGVNITLDDVNTILKLNSNGVILSQFSFNVESIDFADLIGVVTLENDEYIIAFENYYGNFFLMRFAADNTILWKKNYAIPDYFGAYYQHQIIQDGTGGIYLMISNGDNLTLLKINSLGNLEWSKAYIGPEAGGKSPGFSICRTPDNGVIATLKDGSSQCVFRVNDLGTVQWSKSFIDMSYRWPTSIRETNDGNYIIAGILDGSIPYLNKITSSGDILFAKTYEFGENYFEVYDAKQHSNGNFYLYGSNGDNSGLIEIDQNGNLLLVNYIEGIVPDYVYYPNYPKFANNETALSFYSCTANDGFHTRIDFDGDMNALCNSVQPEQASSMNDNLITQAVINTGLNVNNVAVTVSENVTFELLAEFDVTAEDFCEYIVDLEETTQEEMLEIYPNPAFDHININTNGGVISQIDLFDLHGKRVLYQMVELSGVQKIDVSNLSPGIYRLVMLIDGNLVNEQIVIRK